MQAYPPRSLNDNRDGQQDVVGVDQAHCDPCEASKGCMDSIVRQDLAVDAVIGRGRNGANQVRRVYVLDISVFEAFLDFALQPGPHIFQDGVATEICLDVTRHQEFLHQTSESPVGRAEEQCYTRQMNSAFYRAVALGQAPKALLVVLSTSSASA